MLQASLFLITYDQSSLISPFNVRLMIQRRQTICFILNKTVLKGCVRAISLKSKTLSISAHHLLSKHNGPEFCCYKRHIWPFKLSPVVFFATDEKDGHGLAMDAKWIG